MKKLILSLVIIFLLFSTLRSAGAVDTENSIFALSMEKGSLYSLDLKYRSYVNESIRLRMAQSSLTYGHFFDKNWSFYSCLPFLYSNQELKNSGGDGKEKEVYLLLGNIAITPQYSFKWKSKTVRLSMGIQLPTINKLYELETKETRASINNLNSQGYIGKLNINENKMLISKPSITISRSYDPVISVVSLSFSQPLWREENREDIHQYWNAELTYGTYFIVNDRFTFNTDLGISTGEDKENYILKLGSTFFSSPSQGWDIYLLNIYNGLIWESTAGISFTITR